MSKLMNTISNAVWNAVNNEEYLDANAYLCKSLCDASRPSFLFGCTPPLASTPTDQSQEIACKFANRGRVLAVDGYIVYDIQDESTRTKQQRPFPFRRLADPCEFAQQLSAASHKGCVVYKAVTCMADIPTFEKWLDDCVNVYDHHAVNIVGAPSGNIAFRGPSTKEASLIAKKKKTVKFGAVCIAERHAAKANEHLSLLRKQEWGAEWFISQGIFDPTAMIQLIIDYGALCKSKGVSPKKIILTFTPMGRKKTLEFVKWLGMNVPAEAENHIFDEQANIAPAKRKSAVQLSCELLCDNMRTILRETVGSGVPLGLNVESVSGYKDEIDATHDLFRSLQAILLDSMDAPWVIRWSYTPASIRRAEQQKLKQQIQFSLFVIFTVSVISRLGWKEK